MLYICGQILSNLFPIENVDAMIMKFPIYKTITDADYFDGFLMHDDVLIRKFMNDCRKAFYSSICKVRGNKSDEFLDEALVITIERLWEKINNQRIELGNLTVSLKDYMIGIGKHVAEELERKYNPSHSTISDMVYFFCPKCGYWEDYELEKYKRQGIKVPICSECQAQMIRHVEREIRDYEVTLLSSSKRESTNSDNGFDGEAEDIGLRSIPIHYLPLEMEQDAQLKMMWKAIDQALEQMKEKCEKILRMRYIEHKSYEDIIALMNYSTTDSAKTQKNKCMPKIKEKAIQIYNQLRNQ